MVSAAASEATGATSASGMATAIEVFQGSDEWVRAQLERNAVKAKQRELRDADPTIIAPFSRDEFTQRVHVSDVAWALVCLVLLYIYSSALCLCMCVNV